MGAHDFTVSVEAKTASEAFSKARDDARDENGHRDGYSGDIQTCRGFVMVKPNAGETIDACVERLLDEPGRTGIEKWGKAGCIETAPGSFLFFGWAAS